MDTGETTRRSLPFLAIPALTLLLAVAACGDSDPAATDAVPASSTTEVMTETSTTAQEAMGDVLEVAAAEGDLGTFLAALEEAGIMDDFHGEGPFTLFIPTDAAFEAYLSEAGMTEDELMSGQEML